MKRLLMAFALLSVLPLIAGGQTRGGWLRGQWEGKGYQTDSDDRWAMRLTVKGSVYTVEYPSLDCAGRWRLLSLNSRRAVFSETITRGAERCAPRGRYVVERLNPRQLGYWYAYRGSNDYVASGILNKSR